MKLFNDTTQDMQLELRVLYLNKKNNGNRTSQKVLQRITELRKKLGKDADKIHASTTPTRKSVLLELAKLYSIKREKGNKVDRETLSRIDVLVNKLRLGETS